MKFTIVANGVYLLNMVGEIFIIIFYLRSSFSQRVIVDGGVVESINCIKI
jgi:hypothetical protein